MKGQRLQKALEVGTHRQHTGNTDGIGKGQARASDPCRRGVCKRARRGHLRLEVLHSRGDGGKVDLALGRHHTLHLANKSNQSPIDGFRSEP